MKKDMRLISSKLIALILIAICAGIAGTQNLIAKEKAIQYAPDEIIVKFKADADEASIRSFNAVNGVLELVRTTKRKNRRVLKIPPSKSVLEMVAQYNQNPDVQWAEPNYIGYTLAIPNDPDYDIGTPLKAFQKWYFELVQAESAWDVEAGDPDVIIAVVDSGVDLDHPDLVNKIWRNEAEYSGGAGIDDDGNGYVDDVYGWDFVGDDDGDDGDRPGDNNPDVFAGDPAVGDGVDQDGDGAADDSVAHGTMVAGIIAAETNNGIGIAGAAWGCKIMAVRVINPEGIDYFSDIADGIEYAADNGANVINLSIGEDVDSSVLRDAIQYAYNKGCVIVAGAGNGNTNPIVYPARYPETIAVGASDRDPDGNPDTDPHRRDDGRAEFSNWGTGVGDNRLVDVVAPGRDIRGTAVQAQTGTAYYALSDGTSFSTAIVSGLAALVISATGITNNPEAIRDYINSGASDLPDDPDDSPDAGPNWDGNGMVKFSQTDSLPVTLSAFTATTTRDGKVILRWTTQTEVNNIGWNIYRSVNGTGTFIKLDGFVSGAGNSAFPNDYQYVDKNVQNGVTYFYYIEDVDIWGKKEKSAIVKVTPRTAAKVLPAEFQLFQNYPNPFNPATWIPYQLVESAEVVIRIYNASGQLVRELNLGNKRAGFYISREKSAFWDGKNDKGEEVTSGIYFYQIKAGSYLSSIRKMILLK